MSMKSEFDVEFDVYEERSLHFGTNVLVLLQELH